MSRDEMLTMIDTLMAGLETMKNQIQDSNVEAFSPYELAVARRYVQQMVASTIGIERKA